MRLNQDFKEFIELLNFHCVEYLVVGGYAVGIYGYPRYTGDLDIWVKPSKENSGRIMKALRDFGFKSPDLIQDEFEIVNRVFQFGYEPNRIDIITSASSLDFNSCYSQKQVFEVEGLEVNFIGLESLKINKAATGRYKDLNDLEHLK